MRPVVTYGTTTLVAGIFVDTCTCIISAQFRSKLDRSNFVFSTVSYAIRYFSLNAALFLSNSLALLSFLLLRYSYCCLVEPYLSWVGCVVYSIISSRFSWLKYSLKLACDEFSTYWWDGSVPYSSNFTSLSLELTSAPKTQMGSMYLGVRFVFVSRLLLVDRGGIDFTCYQKGGTFTI